MALHAVLTKRGNTLVAEDAMTMEAMQRIKNGQQVRVVITSPRNIKHHRLLFALLNICVENQPEPRMFPTTKKFLLALKMGMGYFTEFLDFEGNTRYAPDSINFATLDQIEFSEWFDAAINVVVTRVLPGCRSETLENEIYHALGEVGPADMSRITDAT